MYMKCDKEDFPFDFCFFVDWCSPFSQFSVATIAIFFFVQMWRFCLVILHLLNET